VWAGGWYEAKVLGVDADGSKVKVHFKGWGKENGKSKWDVWLPMDSARMAPLESKVAPARKPIRPECLLRITLFVLHTSLFTLHTSHLVVHSNWPMGHFT
jgi:hypothetical protein